ncbi:class I SAM-dependent methyltransferase [bacterium]|nr:class I SAM-dependent methyltransferase [bacterium]
MSNKNSKPAYPKGVYDISYYIGRQTNTALKYRLRRRTDEVVQMINKYRHSKTGSILDIGTADALMLSQLSSRLNGDYLYIGLDYCFDLLSSNPSIHINKVQGDALRCPIRPDSVSIVIATAVIEHVPNASGFIHNVRDILIPGGLFIITTPNPLLAHISEKIGLLKEPGHHQEFTLKALQRLLEQQQFTVIDKYKFMFSPIGFPAEKFFEKIFRTLGFSFIMANQLIICEKS